MDLGIKTMTLKFDDNQLGHLAPIQGDTKSRGFVIEMVSADGEIVPADSLHECRLYGVNSNYPDKTFYTKAEVVDGKYKVYLSTDMVSKAGTLKMQIALYKGSEELIQSEVKEVQVTESMANGGSIGKDLVVDFTKLEKALERVDTQEKAYQDSLQKQEVIKADIDSKQKQVSTDTTTVKKIRQDMEGVMAAEASRVSAEKTRQSQESTRQSQETTRKSQESTRQNQETTRKSQESQRIEAEKKRVLAETERASDEKTRQTNENKRKFAENTRSDNDAMYSRYEEQRQLQEKTRQSQETARVEAEKKRKSTFESWDLTMQGVIPNATLDKAGVVKVNGLSDEEAPYTVHSIGIMNKEMDYILNEAEKKADKVHSHSISDVKDLDGWLKQLANSTTENMANLAQKADKIHVHRDKDIILDSTGDTLENYVETLDMTLGVAIDSKISFRGQNPAKNIQIIEKGTSISDIPEETLIFELE